MRRGTTQHWIPSIFNDFFDNNWMVRSNATAPAINVLENEKEYTIEWHNRKVDGVDYYYCVVIV